jgi:hypothetical protein
MSQDGKHARTIIVVGALVLLLKISVPSLFFADSQLYIALTKPPSWRQTHTAPNRHRIGADVGSAPRRSS